MSPLPITPAEFRDTFNSFSGRIANAGVAYIWITWTVSAGYQRGIVLANMASLTTTESFGSGLVAQLAHFRRCQNRHWFRRCERYAAIERCLPNFFTAWFSAFSHEMKCVWIAPLPSNFDEKRPTRRIVFGAESSGYRRKYVARPFEQFKKRFLFRAAAKIFLEFL